MKCSITGGVEEKSTLRQRKIPKKVVTNVRHLSIIISNKDIGVYHAQDCISEVLRIFRIMSTLNIFFLRDFEAFNIPCRGARRFRVRPSGVENRRSIFTAPRIVVGCERDGRP